MEYWSVGVMVNEKEQEQSISETAGAAMTLRPVLSDEEMEGIQKSAQILKDIIEELKIEK